MKLPSMNLVKINRDIGEGTFRLDELFTGIKDAEILLRVFETKEDINDVSSRTTVTVQIQSHYMHVNTEDATLVIGLDHLKTSDTKMLYLDIVHVLVQVRQ